MDVSLQTRPVFEAVRLSAADLTRVYPLLRMVDPNVSLSEWLSFARRKVGRARLRGGLVALRDVRGYYHATFSFCVEPRLARGSVFRVDSLMVGLLPGQFLNRALVEAIEQFASECQCASIHIALSDSAEEARYAPMRSLFLGAGYRPYSAALIRETGISAVAN